MNFLRRFENVVTARGARDLQRRVGPSNLSNPCARCLAYDLMGVDSPDSPFIMGAKIGTAVHDWLEKRVQQFEPTWVTERKLYIGELGTYGPITGSCDLYVPEAKLVVDYKTTTRDKLQGLIDGFQADDLDKPLKIQAYIAQTHLYALGAELAGDEVENITIIFIPRDSVTYDDIRSRTIKYDRDYAQHVLDRARSIWEWLEDGGDPEDLSPTEGCFTCDYHHR